VSWEIAKAKVGDEIIGYLYYDGTGGSVFPLIVKTEEEAHWKNGILSKKTPERFTCFCPNPIDIDGEEVIMYGTGRPLTIHLDHMSWPARYCRKCMVITNGLCDDAAEVINGI
jgi:hypothetical protein